MQHQHQFSINVRPSRTPTSELERHVTGTSGAWNIASFLCPPSQVLTAFLAPSHLVPLPNHDRPVRTPRILAEHGCYWFLLGFRLSSLCLSSWFNRDSRSVAGNRRLKSVPFQRQGSVVTLQKSLELVVLSYPRPFKHSNMEIYDEDFLCLAVPLHSA